jgi:ribosomal protein S6--L-glutamate ligase
MRLVILSRSARIHSTARLVAAARAAGHTARVVDPLEVELGLAAPGPTLRWRGGRFPAADVVIPRIGVSIHQYGLSVVKQLELAGVPVLNGAAAIEASRHRMRSLQLLSAAGLPVPRTVMASGPRGLAALVERVGGVPVLLKVLSPDGKGGVMVCESLQSLEAALEAVQGLGRDLVVQQYLRGGRGRDLRALVVCGEVVAALRRRAATGRFARTLRRGARFDAVALPARHRAIAVEAAAVLGLRVCAVDMLDEKEGPLVFEVNASPSIREVEAACEIDVAARVVACAASLARVG